MAQRYACGGFGMSYYESQYDKMRLEKTLNPKKYKNGQVLWYVANRAKIGVTSKKTIEWGIKCEDWHDAIGLTKYDMVDDRLIDGVPIDKCSFPTKWNKLPKGWTYDTDLVHLSWVFQNDVWNELGIDITKAPDNTNDWILYLIEKGYYIPRATKGKNIYKGCKIETEIDNKQGYRLVAKHDGEYYPSFVTIPHYEVFETREEAQEFIDAYNADLQAIADMSDYDWSVMEMDKTLARWVLGNAEEKEKVKEFLLSLDRVEDIETRVSMGHVEWKYADKKRWNGIELN